MRLDVGVAGFLRSGELIVGHVAVLREEPAVELEKLLVGTGFGGGDASIGDLFASDSFALA